ncbi:hypothetical protein BABINDRAFT_161731 [Babjeviella inositovora NRRL Y-12698]|uniref:DNA replication licensing factor MCM5 n=1 Tax=Babjeviella inositovora NRRL Y-12698 TaxID=984486 RepID=A0A1E3QNR5_9ASCO|nr:uncharacterized protein BABINDRAFT_161731 [Babjeviella inositovora NRRL Y-12698]ODQ79321.1 hypothetical protein BABINDRAFT_161731 [Babjeviella inositovora NRRL Y-12698]
MSFDRPDTYGARVLAGAETADDSFSEVIKAFRLFILEFRLDSRFIYRDQLRENVLIKQYSLTVNTEHLIRYNDELNKKLSDDPTEMLPLFETAITEVAKRIAFLTSEEVPLTFPTCQLILDSQAEKVSIRDLDADHIAKIVRISGIVISASVLSSRPTSLQILCRSCKHTTKISVGQHGFANVQLPKQCGAPPQPGSETNSCPPDPYTIVHEKSVFVDQQSLKLQESPDMVPVGEMPRHILLNADRYLTNRIIPGTRCNIIGIYSIYQAKVKGANSVAIRNPYMKILGIQTDLNKGSGIGGMNFTEEEEEEFLTLARQPGFYETFSKSIAPSIYGNEDIKKAITCLLMGGSKKLLPDNMRLRGDINVLLLGDPGTAKSQLLKFVEKVSPISVYTSGKGSSAAGLTASVQRDPHTRDFYLEGGAMVLADGGVVCIDEFDKMRDEDRVAIHEAMEQQTISIAKAGITTILNSRTSVLAAANPIYGRYDEMKSPGENIDFQTTILSRFDMIFIVKDDHNEARDISIAQHVMNVHTGRSNQNDAEREGEIPIEKMKKFISYARANCAPRLSPEASEKLSSYFVDIRQKIQGSEAENLAKSTIPITVRQLEAIVRITESLAKLELATIATIEHVDEAIRLFYASTMDAAGQNALDGGNNKELMAEVVLVENEIKRRLPIGWSILYRTLRREFVEGRKHTQMALDRALMIMERRESISFKFQRQRVFRDQY